MTVVIFIIVLAVLIFVHELGHFLTARACGIRVDAFKIGFGPKLIAWRRGETEYGINWIPFGGFVRIHGENPDEEATSGPDALRSFVNKPRWQQVIVLASGVLMNFLFAWLIYACVFGTGVTASVDGFEKYADRFQNQRIMITYVLPASPAEKAGLKEGDVIESVGSIATGQRQSVEEVQAAVNAGDGGSVTVHYLRGDVLGTAEIVPLAGFVQDRYAIGISMDNITDLRLPIWSAVSESLHYTLVMIKETVIGLYTFLANIFRGAPNFSDVAGPIGIAGIVGNAAELGFTYLLMITAIISINLGVVNLIPFPALDGGRILFVLIEGAFRRRIPARFANSANLVGFALLMILMVAVTWKDIAKLIS